MAIQIEVSRDGPADKTREVLGTEAHFHEVGSGPSIFYVHDWLETAYAWGPLSEELGPRYKQIAVDLPGFGSTPVPDGWDHSLPLYRDFLQAALRESSARDTTLLLHGFGILVGVSALLEPAGEASRRVSRIVLLNGPLYEVPKKGFARLRRAGEFDAITQAPPQDLPAFRRRLLARFADPTYFDDGFAEGLYHAWKTRGPKTLYAHARHLSEFREALPKLRKELAEWPGPIHVLWGEEDPLLGHAPATLMHQELPRAKVLLFPEVGHLPHVEAPKALAEQLRKIVRVSRPPAILR